MVLKAFISATASILVISMTCGSCLANSEDNSPKGNIGFFTQGSVSDMSIPMEETSAPELQYGPTKGFKVEKKEVPQIANLNAIIDQAKKEAGNQEISIADEKIPEGVDAEEYKLRKEFGDPSETVPVKGIDTAPKPYKAMLKAIDMGRDDLALMYANQWMGYMKNLDRITRKATAMAGVVKLDPAVGEEKVSNAAFSNIDPKALNQFFAKRKEELAKNQAVGNVEITEQSRSAISAIFGDSDSQDTQQAAKLGDNLEQPDAYAKLLDTSLDPISRKMLIRSTLAGKLPLDPSGNVQVLFFMRPSEQASIDLGKQLAMALSSPTLDVSVGIVPLSVDGVELTANSKFYQNTGIPANLRDGAALSRSLNITQFPSLLFLTENSEQAFFKAGKADALFIEEVSRMIGGK